MSTIHKLFHQQARCMPQKTAIVHRQNRITYQELDQRSEQLANILMQSGVTPGQSVVLFLDRSPEAIISMLAILKAGGVYVPIDITSPQGRISYQFTDCDPTVVLASQASVSQLPTTSVSVLVVDEIAWQNNFSIGGFTTDVSRESPAYIIYTSGTTGAPKGVIVAHRGVVRLVSGQEYITFGPEKKFLQLASLAFDAATFEIWGALLHGGTCVIYPGDTLPDPTILQQLIAAENITTAWLTATLFNTLVTIRPEALQGLSELITGGEALSVHHVRKALDLLPDTNLINGYGPTENTTFTACYRIPSPLPDDWSSIPIGEPIRQTSIHVLDENLRPVPAGKIGELYVGGDGLALGYCNLPDLTAERFIVWSVSGQDEQRLYRTGDLVRMLPDGNLDYLGRIDEQVKIRGFRIEPAEIASVLLDYPEIIEAVVIVYTDDRNTDHLVAYIVAEKGDLNTGPLRPYLSSRLPEYMIPSSIVQLETIPMNRNGKLDRARLPVPSFSDQDEIIEPGTPVEKQLASIWSRLLNQSRISITDNFFDIGGTSLLGLELIEAINITLQPKPPLDPVLLYQFPSIRTLAAHLSSLKQEVVDSTTLRAKQRKSAFGKFKKVRK